jgi:hypothetical protein
MVGERISWRRCAACGGSFLGVLQDVPLDDVGLRALVHLDGRPWKLGDRLACETCGAKGIPEDLPELSERDAVVEVHHHMRPTDPIDSSKHRLGAQCWCEPGVVRSEGRVDVHHQDWVGTQLGGPWRVTWEGGVPDPLPGVAR